MSKEYTSLGLMSGTSGDGVDASVIKSDGNTKFEVIDEKLLKYDNRIFDDYHNLREKIHVSEDLNKFSSDIKELERKITLFHAAVFKDFSSKKVDLIGFHGQTIYHNAKEKISTQLGDGKLLSQLTKTDVVYNFRINDIKNGGEGAPLAPIFHQLVAKEKNLELPVCILNIGGISNITVISEEKNPLSLISRDIGPGNCLIDNWVRKNSNKKFDKDGLLAASGTTDEIIYEQALELFSNTLNQNHLSLDVNDFDISFARGLNLVNGVATLTDLTANIISSSLMLCLSNLKKEIKRIIVCGGGRKNNILIEKIKNKISKKYILQNIDDFGVDGDFVESQAFAFLAIRSILSLPISFPKTTGCNKPSIGGEIVKFK